MRFVFLLLFLYIYAMNIWFWIFIAFWLFGGLYLLFIDAYQHGNKIQRFRWFHWGKFRPMYIFAVLLIFILSWIYVAFALYDQVK